MFGYIVINQAEMKFREYDVYHSFYCGLCKSLKERHGKRGQMTLTYDMTFIVMLLTGLYEPDTRLESCKCIVHPFQKHPTRCNKFSDYCADMNVLLSYEKCKDDWNDEKKVTRRTMASLLKRQYGEVLKRYPEKTLKILASLDAIYKAEKQNVLDIDTMAGYYGEVMAEIFAYDHDVWEETLRTMGFYMGKFIYLMDAFEDVEEDVKKGLYNPWKDMFLNDREHFDKETKEILTMMMAECSRNFEKLPILENVEILRNILYSGVWHRYYQVVTKRGETQENS